MNIDWMYRIIAENGTGRLHSYLRKRTDMADARETIVLVLRNMADEIEGISIGPETGVRFSGPESTSQDNDEVIE